MKEFLLLEFNKTNKNGRIYLRHSVSEIPKTALCTFGVSDKWGKVLAPPINDESTFGVADLRHDENGVYATVKVFEEKKGMFEELMMSGCKFYPLGTGRTNESGEVEDYRIHSVYIAPSNE